MDSLTSLGNGAAIRVAPLAIAIQDRQLLIETVATDVRATHVADEAVNTRDSMRAARCLCRWSVRQFERLGSPA